MPDGTGRPWDPGLQPERTTLAWVRTGLSLTAVSLLLARLSGNSGVGALAAGLGGLVLAEALVVLQASRHRRRNARLRAGVLLPAMSAAVTLTGATVLLAVTALGFLLRG